MFYLGSDAFEDGHKIGRSGRLPGFAVISFGKGCQKFIFFRFGHVVNSIGVKTAKSFCCLHHHLRIYSAVNVFTVGHHHHEPGLILRHFLHELKPCIHSFVEDGRVGHGFLIGVDDKIFQVDNILGFEAPDQEIPSSQCHLLFFAEDNDLHSVDRPEHFKEYVDSCQERLHRLAFQHGIGVVKHQNEITWNLKGLRKRLGRNYPRCFLS